MTSGDATLPSMERTMVLPGNRRLRWRLDHGQRPAVILFTGCDAWERWRAPCGYPYAWWHEERRRELLAREDRARLGLPSLADSFYDSEPCGLPAVLIVPPDAPFTEAWADIGGLDIHWIPTDTSPPVERFATQCARHLIATLGAQRVTLSYEGKPMFLFRRGSA